MKEVKRQNTKNPFEDRGFISKLINYYVYLQN